MVEFGNSWEFDDDLQSLLDFPMDSLEGDELADDWDISDLQCLGPIPSNVIMGPLSVRNDNIDTWPPGLFAPIDGATGKQQQQLSNHVDTSSSLINQLNKLANVQDSGAFKTQSPVSVLDSSGSCLGRKGLSTKPNNAIPVRRRSKRIRPVGVNPWLLASAVFSTSQHAQRSNESRKKSFQHPSPMDFMKDSPKKVENPLAVPDPSCLKSASSHRSVVTKKCLHCESTKTPQWREGPMGPKTLCNACGVRYRSGRLFPEYRPAKSPSFAPMKHSNSHRKVIEMRNKQPAGTIKITEGPEQKQLSNRVGASTFHICQKNKFSSIQESGALETQSSVPVLESGSKRVRSARVYTSRLASKTLNTRSKDTLQMPILESGGSILAGKGLSIERDSIIPVQSRKRVRPQPFLASSELSTPQKTLNTRRSKEGKKKPSQHPPPVNLVPIIKVENSPAFQRPAAMNFTPIKVEYSPALSDLGHGQNASAHRPLVNRKCAHCESTKTPQWREREGPMGLLCNACGVRYRKGRLLPEYRPADSPTFAPSKHSNSHKRVIEMRNKAKQVEGKIKVTPISTQQEAKTEEPHPSPPQPEFVPMISYFLDYIN
ncbi:hypothetical protein ACS0TY_020355 [Phlomoides rotata]